MMRTKPHFDFIAQKMFIKFFDNPEKLAEGYFSINIQSFELVKS